MTAGCGDGPVGEGEPVTRRVVVSLRSDAEAKPGGDVSLLRSFARQLADDHEVEVVVGVPSVHDLRGADVVVTANLDRPVEPAATLARAERAGVMTVHYTLHHPAPGVSAYLAAGVHGVRSQLARLAAGDPVRYEQLLWNLHALNGLRRGRRPIVGSVARAQRRLLSGANVVVASELEVRAIERDVGTLDRYQVVAHPTDFPPGRHEPVAGRVVVPGRVESRKNQLLALELARRFPSCEFLFVGALNRSDRRFVQRFAEELDGVDNARHLEHLPKDEFYPLLRSAEAVVSASWFEVTSLIELYCADNAIPLVVSEHSYLQGEGPIHRFDPADVQAATEALAVCLADSSGRYGDGPDRGIGATLTGTAARTINDVVAALG